MRRTTLLLALAIALALPSGPAGAAPKGHHATFTPVAGWVMMSRELPADSLEDAVGFGLRLGYQFDSPWGLELAATYSPSKNLRAPGGNVDYEAVSGNLMFTPGRWPIGELFLAAGAGWSSRPPLGTLTWKNYNYMTFDQAVGWTSWFGDHTGLRLEFRNSLNVPEKNYQTAKKAEQSAWAGLTWAIGGKSIDTDRDGVPDKKDKCAATPIGATVDATGCPHDADGDGVWDGLDQCPDTPKGAKVDARGCPADADGDGVWDGLDQCPDTPEGAKVDAKGCPIDTDGDGVWDGLDQCAASPKGATVDAQGCPIDTDGDGVWDGIDLCPGTPAGARVDANGCPIEVTEKETELLDTGMIRLQGVNFERGKADLLPESLPMLDQVGPILIKWPQLQIEVGGHCDSTGSAGRNLVLSEARAAAVRAYVMLKFPGIAEGQLTSKGYGSSVPVAPNSSQLNMAKNRRVEFVVLNKDVLKKEVERRRTLQK